MVIDMRIDPYNLENKRNVRNTDRLDYNCGGYALECFSWYQPRLIDRGCRAYAFNSPSENHRSTQLSVKRMLQEFPDLRVIQSLDEVQGDEYPILFRHSSDGDFHFIKRCNDGVWRHKRGGTFIDTISKTELWGVWCHRYDGEIVILAKKKRY